MPGAVTCGKCGKFFSRLSSLKRHKEQVCPDSEEESDTEPEDVSEDEEEDVVEQTTDEESEGGEKTTTTTMSMKTTMPLGMAWSR